MDKVSLWTVFRDVRRRILRVMASPLPAHRGKVPGRPTLDTDKLASALKLVEAGIRPAQAARQLGLGRSTL